MHEKVLKGIKISTHKTDMFLWFLLQSMQLLSADEFLTSGHQAVLCNYSMNECNILQLFAAYKANCITEENK